jgi:hypothetical protein
MPNDTGELVLDTDASFYAIGTVLGQRQNGVERVIAYGSRWLKTAESNYCTMRRKRCKIFSVLYFELSLRREDGPCCLGLASANRRA